MYRHNFAEFTGESCCIWEVMLMLGYAHEAGRNADVACTGCCHRVSIFKVHRAPPSSCSGAASAAEFAGASERHPGLQIRLAVLHTHIYHLCSCDMGSLTWPGMNDIRTILNIASSYNLHPHLLLVGIALLPLTDLCQVSSHT